MTNQEINTAKALILQYKDQVLSEFEFSLHDRGRTAIKEYPFIDIYRKDKKTAGPCGVYDVSKNQLIAFYQDKKMLQFGQYKRFDCGDDFMQALDRFHYFVYSED